MIQDQEFCELQVLRFSGLPGWPKTAQGKTELVDAAQKSFQYQDQLIKAVSNFLRSGKRCPTPADFYELAGEEKRYGAGHKGPYRCFICYDTGAAYSDFLCTYRNGVLVEKQRVTPEQAGDLGKKLPLGCGGSRQAVYELPVPCGCKTTIERRPE